jgi:chloramphenicol 3-O-phosphotransferase
VIDLDDVADELAGTGSPSGDARWTLARHEAATRANAILGRGVAVVIADGSFNTPTDRAAFEEALRPTTIPHYVTLRVSFDEALRRARRDPTRGRSQDPEFLGSYFAGRHETLGTPLASDLVIDTETMTAAEAAAAIAHRLQPEHVP